MKHRSVRRKPFIIIHITMYEVDHLHPFTLKSWTHNPKLTGDPWWSGIAEPVPYTYYIMLHGLSIKIGKLIRETIDHDRPIGTSLATMVWFFGFLRSSGNGRFNFRSSEWIFRSSSISSRESFLISLHSWVAKPVSWQAAKKAAIARCLKTKQRTKCHQRILCFQKGKQAAIEFDFDPVSSLKLFLLQHFRKKKQAVRITAWETLSCRGQDRQHQWGCRMHIPSAFPRLHPYGCDLKRRAVAPKAQANTENHVQ